MRKLKEISSYIKDVWRGEKYPSEEGKFRVILYALGLVHLILFTYFLLINSQIIAIYNVFSAIYYLVSAIAIKKGTNFFHTFVAAFFEIVLYSSVVTVLCGWNLGFAMYIIALCPVSFFTTYALPGRSRSFVAPTVFSAICITSFIITKTYVDRIGAILTLNIAAEQVRFIYNFNCFVTFGAIIFFSALFALEIGAKEKELEKQNSELADISSVDPLTKLLNRRTMDVCLDEAVKNIKKTGELFTIAIGDIDNFKMVNDIHGHNVGDDVLKMVAKTIRETLPDKGILCRWGGEEFLILLRMPEIDAVPIIESVRYAVSQQYVDVEKPDGDIKLGVTMTYGVSQYIHGFPIEKVISIADENLYKGKANGKNRVVHSKTEIII